MYHQILCIIHGVLASRNTQRRLGPEVDKLPWRAETKVRKSRDAAVDAQKAPLPLLAPVVC